MNNKPKINENPPDGWLLKLHIGDCVYDNCNHKGIFFIKSVERSYDDDAFFGIKMYKIYFTNYHSYYVVDRNGVYTGRNDLLPIIKNIPDDAGDGE